MQFKVVTPVSTEPVLLADARLQLRLTADDSTAEDDLIEAYITAAREIAEHYTGCALAPQTLEAALDAFPGEDYIDLPMPPVASVTSVKYTDAAGDEQTMDAADYSLSAYGESRRINLAADADWPTDVEDMADAVRIRYVTGFGAAVSETTPHPHRKAVKQAILLMVAWMHEHRGDQMDPNDIQPPAAKALLDTVKRWGRG